jgi:tricorn protease
LQKPAAKGASYSNDIDWEDVHRRVQKVASVEADGGTISPDGTKVAFRSAGSSGYDLWVATTDGRSLNRITTGNMFPHYIRWSKSLPLIYFLDRTGTMRLGRAGGLGLSTDQLPIPFQAKLTIRRDEEFAEMFEQSWRGLRDHFYDEKFHGANWNEVRSKYRQLVKHVAMKEDLYVLITLMLGELNASHLGISSGRFALPEEITADLGLVFDESFKGPALKVADILKGGPADKRGIQVKKGDYIVSIDGETLTEKSNLSKLLNNKAGETVVVGVADTPTADPKSSSVRQVELTAVHRFQVADLMYERWVDSNAAKVKELSKGKLGYIHIPSMDEEGLERFVRALYSDNTDKEAIVLDVRFNSGGFTHDQVLNYLGGKDHTFFHQRDGGQGTVLRYTDRKWSKPLVLLINNRSFSDAEIFPHAFRTLGLGKLVGQSTGGQVIGTVSIPLIDGSRLRLPRTGVFTVKGINMEKEGVKPDISVEDHPDELARGEDKQLAKAVEVLRQDVLVWKKKQEELVKKTAANKKTNPTQGTGTNGRTVVGPMKP